MTVTGWVAELYEQLKTADALLFWSYMPNNTQPALYNLVSSPPKCACCMLSIICTLCACNKSCKKTNTKYEYKSNIAHHLLANTYSQIRPNQILAFGSKYESNITVFIQIRIKFQNALLFGCIWSIWRLNWLWDNRRKRSYYESKPQSKAYKKLGLYDANPKLAFEIWINMSVMAECVSGELSCFW